MRCSKKVKQTVEDVQFIFLNDCSTDLSSNILEKYKELDQRIIGDAANLLI